MGDLFIEVPSGLSTADRFFSKLIKGEVGEIDGVALTSHALINDSCLSGLTSGGTLDGDCLSAVWVAV